MLIRFRNPQPQDGPAIHRLIAACPPLDTNSLYCNLLQCSYFSSTCLLAQRAEKILGFVSGLWLPEQPATLFVWQVAVSAEARGQRLGVRMLENLLHTTGARHLQTTVTPSNSASWAMFATLARRLTVPLTSTPLFDSDVHFESTHESEMLVCIGPLQRLSASRKRTAIEENV